MNEGYILLFRSLFENEFLFGDGHKFTKPEMWIWMLTYARWQDSPCTFTIRGNKVTVNRGELAESVRTLSEVWKWSNKSVIKVLNEFEAEGMIEIERSTVINKIRIVNYDKFQLNFTQQTTQQTTQQPTQQNEPYIYGGLKEIEQIATQQITQQNTQQITQPFKTYKEINICCYSDDFEKKLFDGLRRYDTQWKAQRCRMLHLTLEAFMDYIDKFEQVCQKNQSWHNYTNNVASDVSSLVKHFNQWIEKELNPKPKQQNYGNKDTYDPTRGFEPKSTYEDYEL